MIELCIKRKLASLLRCFISCLRYVVKKCFPRLRKEGGASGKDKGSWRPCMWTLIGCGILAAILLAVMTVIWFKMDKVAGEASYKGESDARLYHTSIPPTLSRIEPWESTEPSIKITEQSQMHQTAKPREPPIATQTELATPSETSPILPEENLQQTLEKLQQIAPDRINCHPEKGAQEPHCLERGCLWDAKNRPNCYYPESIGYAAVSGVERTNEQVSSGGEILLKKVGHASPYSPDVQNVKLSHEYLGADGILHFKFWDADRERYEVPLGMIRIIFYRHVGDSDAVLWDTKPGGLVFSDQFLQIGTRLPSENVYGLGESGHLEFKRNFTEYRTWSLFAWGGNPVADELNYRNLYGVHPFYICIEPDGKAHGVLLLNSNAQEYTTGPGNLLLYRTIGGVMDFYLFPGPTPRDVIRQYWSLIGRPTVPPYWALGFQLCRYGYKNTAEIKDAVERTKKYGIPHDVQYADIDYMDGKRDFTVDQTNFPDLADYVNEKRKGGMRWVFILEPATSVGKWSKGPYETFNRGKEMNVYVDWPQDMTVPAINSKYESTKRTRIMLGTVWPEANVAFADWLRPNTSVWWRNEMKLFWENVLKFDGIWIDMNEPTNFHTNHPDAEQYEWYETKSEPLVCPDNQWEDPPYKTKAVGTHKDAIELSYFTICMVGNQFNANQSFRHYDVHNIYGHSEAKVTLDAIEAATESRSFVLSRSTFVGSGRYTAHWLGDNHATWEDMRASIIGIMEFNMFGVPMVGADICGFGGNTTEELCLRWSQLGAFYPFSRNHDSIHSTDQDPGIWPSVGQAAKKALDFRYKYLPYLYTLLYQAHSFGKNVLNPLIFEFPTDHLAARIDQQFMWGECMLISPVLYERKESVRAYFPNATWYSMVERNFAMPVIGPRYETLDAKLAEMIPVHVKAGCILPRQAPANNTAFSRKNPLELLIALHEGEHANGHLFWDDGVQIYRKEEVRWRRWYIKFAYARTKSRERTINVLTVEVLNSPRPRSEVEMPNLEILEVFGLKTEPDWESFRWNGVGVGGFKDKVYDGGSQRMRVSVEGLVVWSEFGLDKVSVLEWGDKH